MKCKTNRLSAIAPIEGHATNKQVPQMFKSMHEDVAANDSFEEEFTDLLKPSPIGTLDPRWKVAYPQGVPYTLETAPMCDVIVGYKMMTFDKLKMVLPYSNNYPMPFDVLNNKAFKCTKKSNGQVYYTYEDKNIKLFIRYGDTKPNCKYKELVIEYTSVILLERKMELISNNNIRDCLKMLADRYNLIRIKDIEYFIHNAYVVRCDVTTDKRLDKDTAKAFLEYTYNNRKNIRKSDMDLYEEVNFTIQNNVKSGSTRKLYFKFYDKGLELKTKANKLSYDVDPNQYKDTYRLELELISPKQVKEYLSIKNNLLYDVLWSDAQPIAKVYDNFVLFVNDFKPLMDNENALRRYSFAKECRFDMSIIEINLRKCHKPWSKKYLNPYREICTMENVIEKDMEKLVQKVKNILAIPYEKHIVYMHVFNNQIISYARAC